MPKISNEESRSLAASLINGIRNSLLISVGEDGNQFYRSDSHQQMHQSKSPSENKYANTLHNDQNTCIEKISSCTNCRSNMMLSNSEVASNVNFVPRRNGVNFISSNNFDYPQNHTSNGLDSFPLGRTVNMIDSNIKYGKKCPKCFEINDKDANWCMECGKAIISVEVRRCDSFEERKSDLLPQYNESRSFPSHCYKNSVSLDEDVIPHFYQNEFVSHAANFHANEIQINQEKTYSIPFDFQNPQLEEESPYNKKLNQNAAVFHKSVEGIVRKQDTPHLYAFDDLLYPNCAIQDPVYGYVLPSSNVFSNGAYLQSQVYADGYVHNQRETRMPNPTTKFKSRNRRNKGKKKKTHLSVPHVESKTNHYIQSTDVMETNDESLLVADVRNMDIVHDLDMLSIINLPEEVILCIFSMLTLSEIAKCTRVCRLFNRIASDSSLWKQIRMKKNHNLTDDILNKIAKKHPSHLTITQCNGKRVTMDGLRNLFRMCAESLQVLDISACSGGVLVGETVLLHVSSRCKNIYKLDVSWSNVSNVGVHSLCDALNRVVELSLNGCQGITDEAITSVAKTHGKSLEVLEVFGCFNISPVSINSLTEHCKSLRKLNLGQCHKISNQALCLIAKKLTCLESLDIRGCKQIRDAGFKEVVMKCYKLTNIVIANCPSITDYSLIAVANSLPDLSCLDACGCGKITDRGVQLLARGCNQLKMVDLSSTKVTGRSVTTMANYCRRSLISLKLSFCHSITDNCLHAVVSKCKRLKILHLYGCKPIRNLQKLMEMNSDLKIEKESLR